MSFFSKINRNHSTSTPSVGEHDSSGGSRKSSGVGSALKSFARTVNLAPRKVHPEPVQTPRVQTMAPRQPAPVSPGHMHASPALRQMGRPPEMMQASVLPHAARPASVRTQMTPQERAHREQMQRARDIVDRGAPDLQQMKWEADQEAMDAGNFHIAKSDWEIQLDYDTRLSQYKEAKAFLAAQAQPKPSHTQAPAPQHSASASQLREAQEIVHAGPPTYDQAFQDVQAQADHEGVWATEGMVQDRLRVLQRRFADAQATLQKAATPQQGARAERPREHELAEARNVVRRGPPDPQQIMAEVAAEARYYNQVPSRSLARARFDQQQAAFDAAQQLLQNEANRVRSEARLVNNLRHEIDDLATSLASSRPRRAHYPAGEYGTRLHNDDLKAWRADVTPQRARRHQLEEQLASITGEQPAAEAQNFRRFARQHLDGHMAREAATVFERLLLAPMSDDKREARIEILEGAIRQGPEAAANAIAYYHERLDRSAARAARRDDR